jgi:peptidyl-prolyl cis-trans isomerase A (cyclophilin A)
VSFASRGPNSRTTQVFVNLGNNVNLDSMGFQPFGRVTTGLDVVYKIYPGYGENPQQPQIQSEGEAYLAREFPKLDKIEKASIIP